MTSTKSRLNLLEKRSAPFTVTNWWEIGITTPNADSIILDAAYWLGIAGVLLKPSLRVWKLFQNQLLPSGELWPSDPDEIERQIVQTIEKHMEEGRQDKLWQQVCLQSAIVTDEIYQHTPSEIRAPGGHSRFYEFIRVRLIPTRPDALNWSQAQINCYLQASPSKTGKPAERDLDIEREQEFLLKFPAQT